MDRRVRRAHYYLGTIAMIADGAVRLDDAIAEFQQELTLVPADPATNLRLGIALVEARRHAAALPALERAVRAEPPPSEGFYYLGRCQLALDRPTDAATSLRRALEIEAASPRLDNGRLRSIHYQLALALQKTGAGDEAAAHFAEAERFSASLTAVERQRLGPYPARAQDSSDAIPAAAAPHSPPPPGPPPGHTPAVEPRERAAPV